MSSNKKYLIVGIVTTLILALGFSLAYFAPIIRGEGKKITVRTGSLAIVFADTQEITEEEILPGWSTSKTFTIENESNNPFYYNINIRDLVNTFVTDFLEYKITSTNGYNMTEYKPIPKSETASLVTLAEGIEIKGLETQEYTIEFRYVDSPNTDQSGDMNKLFEGYLSITEGEKLQFPKESLGEKLLSNNTTILERTDFDNPFEEENTGILYKASGNETEDVDGDGIGEDVYYFAGNAQNNWVKFGKDQSDADLYWRIIRTNEDGSIKLLYVGPDKATESAFISIDGTLQNKIAYNGNETNPIYAGYMYGEAGSLESNRLNTTNSNIKIKTDLWYSKTINIKKDILNNTYDKYVSRTAIYCNDRSGDAYSNNRYMGYAAFNRLYHTGTNGRKPTYKCGYNAAGGYTTYNSGWKWNTKAEGMYSDASVADKFSVSASNGGNGQLEYPIAQITADEIAYAGGKVSTTAVTWYYYNSIGGSAVGSGRWWTMSSSDFDSNFNSVNVFGILGTINPGSLGNDSVNNTKYGIRPVLSLKSCVKYVSGDGSSDSPYEVSVDSTCASLEN